MLHEGHRQRMYSKLENGDTLFDHEVLEILLFEACPRINTNPLAHELLERFCTIQGVLSADIAELKTVKGVGDRTARYLKTVGLCYERVGKVNGLAVLKTFGDCKNFICMRLRGKTEENLELYFFEKNGTVNRVFNYSSEDRNKVTAKADVIVRNIALAKPYGIIAAHNHLNGSSLPSGNDDDFTRQLQLICSMNNVFFYDHIIYAGENNIYSYKDSGKLDEISRGYSLNSLIKWINNSN